MNFDQDLNEFLEFKPGGQAGDIEFSLNELATLKLFVAYLNCKYDLSPQLPDDPGDR